MIWLVALLHAVSVRVSPVPLHSGTGRGLSDMFGGQRGAQVASSTVVERNLDRVTIMVQVFGFTSVSCTLILRLIMFHQSGVVFRTLWFPALSWLTTTTDCRRPLIGLAVHTLLALPRTDN